MTNCVKCGTAISEGSKFCSNCGAALKENLSTVQEVNDVPVIKSNRSVYAITSLVFGSISMLMPISLVIILREGWILNTLMILLPIFGILAIIFGIAGIKQIRNDSHLSGMNMTMAGLIMGAVITMISIWFCILLAGY